MKRIALLAQNEHDAESALLVARQLVREGWAEVEFLSLDEFFRQRAQQVFAGSGIEVRVVEPKRALRRPFYHLSKLGRLVAVLANQRQLSSLTKGYDAVLVGCDGALERVVINAMRKRQRPAYLLLSSFYFSRPESRLTSALRRILTRLRLNHLFFSQIGQGMSHRIFAAGEYSRLELCKMGVGPERIEVTGSPRLARMIAPALDPATQILGRLQRSRPIRLLYLMGSWQWHGLHVEAEREMEQLERCAQIARGSPGELELTVRLHPRSSEAEKERLRSIPGIQAQSAEQPLSDHLRASDVVLAVVSTGLLEALALGRLALVVDLFAIGRGFRLFQERGMWVVSNERQLQDAFAELLSPGPQLARRVQREVDALWYFLSRRTPEAVSRIASMVRSDLGA